MPQFDTGDRPSAGPADRSEEPRSDTGGAGAGYRYDSFPVYNSIPATQNGRAAAQLQQTAANKSRARALAPDLLRGLLMVIMAMDHSSVFLNSWKHGTGGASEADGFVVTNWNRAAGYIVRTMTHLCGSGFTFLLGMGVVYLGNSRLRMGWSSWRLARYFTMRMVVLTVLGSLLGLIVTAGKIWFLNMVLFSLAVDYLLAGLLWLAMNQTEPMLTDCIVRSKTLDTNKVDNSTTEDDDIEQPLLRSRQAESETARLAASNLSWHIHNAILAILSIVTIFWNIRLSENHGHCTTTSRVRPESTATIAAAPKNVFLRLWFWIAVSEHIQSAFPPMAWLSFAILGLLYGRVTSSRPWTVKASIGHAAVGLGFAIVFILTRVLQFGNLSEDCLRTPAHKDHPTQNQYLVSPASFFYVVKYPPDVAFWAFTMAGNFLLLAAFGGLPMHYAKRLTMLLDFGSSALFFYFVHMFVLAGAGFLSVKLFGHEVPSAIGDEQSSQRGIDNIFGYFGVWALCMLTCWPLCRWYGRFKSTKGPDSLWRFF